MPNSKKHPLLTLYSILLRLYPTRFRHDFAPQILDTFSDLLHDRGPLSASLLILREFIPTLLREHLENTSSLRYLIRLLLCLLPPIAIYAWALRDAHSFDEYFLSTSWTLCILASLYLTRCRGRRCLVRTTLASVLGMLLPMTLINLHHPMDPSLAISLFPFALFSLTVGLILSAYARLVMEGLALKSN